MKQRLIFILLSLLVRVLMLITLVRSEECIQIRDECLANTECGFALGETTKPDVCGAEASSPCLIPESQKEFCVQMLEMLRRIYNLDECTCDADDMECRQFHNMITRHPCEVGDGQDLSNPTPGSKPISNEDSISSLYDFSYAVEEEKHDKVAAAMNPITKALMSKSQSDTVGLLSSERSYDTDFSSGSSWKSSDVDLVDCWTESNRCRRNRACDKAITTFEMACSCDVNKQFACASDAPKCQEARYSLDAFSLVNCGCPENMKHRKRCQYVYDKFFNNPCIDGCQSYVVQSDTALNAKILPYEDAINKCTETEGVCLDYLLALSAACHNCSQARCQQATGDFIRHVDPIISHSVLFSDCKESTNGEECVDTTSKRECAVSVSPVPNCLELPVQCQGILGCQVQFQNFQNHCDPNRCDRDVYTSCRTAYAALFATPIAINCTCDPEDVHFPQCRVFQRRVSENSCVDKSLLYFKDPTLEDSKDHDICTVKLAGETNTFSIKMDTFIRVPNTDGQSSLCQCKADGELGYCHDIPIMQNMSCNDNQSTDNEMQRRNGICACVDGEFLCSKPESELDVYQLDNGQTYLFIGYSISELQYISESIGEQVPDEAFLKQLQQLLDDESQVTSKCELVLIPLNTQGNLLLKSFEEGGDRKKTSVTCIGSLMHLASMVNGRKMPLVTSPVLSVLKIASVDHFDINGSRAQRLGLSSGTRRLLPRYFPWLIVLAIIYYFN